MTTEKTYPIELSDGFFCEDDTDETFNIETKVYENGNKIKRVQLTDNRVAIIRELNGADMEKLDRLIEVGKISYVTGIISYATKINGENFLPEDIQKLKAVDYNSLKIGTMKLNFMSSRNASHS